MEQYLGLTGLTANHNVAKPWPSLNNAPRVLFPVYFSPQIVSASVKLF